MGTEIRDKRVPVFVVAFLCGLAWGVGELTREPWPFPIFPSFGEIPNERQVTNEERQLFVFHSAEESTRLELGEVFDDPVGSFYAPMTKSFMAIEGDEGSSNMDRWVNERAQDELGWSQCVQAVELVRVSAKDEASEELLKRLEFPTCQ